MDTPSDALFPVPEGAPIPSNPGGNAILQTSAPAEGGKRISISLIDDGVQLDQLSSELSRGLELLSMVSKTP